MADTVAYVQQSRFSFKTAVNNMSNAVSMMKNRLFNRKSMVSSISISCENMDANIRETFSMAVLDMRQNFIVMSRLNDAGVDRIEYDNAYPRSVKFVLNGKASDDVMANVSNALSTLDSLYFKGDRVLRDNVPVGMAPALVDYDAKTDEIKIDDIRRRMESLMETREVLTADESRVVLCRLTTLFPNDASEMSDERLTGNTSYKRELGRKLSKSLGLNVRPLIDSIDWDGYERIVTVDADQLDSVCKELDITKTMLVGAVLKESSAQLLAESMASANYKANTIESANFVNTGVSMEEAVQL